MIFTRDQRRTLMRKGRVTLRTPVELDENLEVLPCQYGTERYSAGKHGEQAKVIAAEKDGLEWVVTFVLVFERERPRLLAKAGGYTDVPALALADEPEAVPRDYQDGLCDDAEDRNAQIKRERLAEMRRGIDTAAAGIAEAEMTRLDRKDLERIAFYMQRIEERAA